VGHADLGAPQILVAEADRLHHGAGGGAIGAFEEDAAVLAGSTAITDSFVVGWSREFYSRSRRGTSA